MLARRRPLSFPRPCLPKAAGLITFAAALLSAGLLGAGLARPASALAARPLRVGTAAALPPGARALGAVAAGAPVSITIALKPSDPIGLAAYADAVSTPGSPLFHEYLTPAEFARRFGASGAAVAGVTASLRAHGLTPTRMSPNGLSVEVRSSASALDRALSLGLERVALPGGRIAIANTAAPAFDPAVADVVQSVVGLQTVNRAHPVGLVRPAASTRSPSTSALSTNGPSSSGPSPCASASATGSYTANQLAAAYGMTPLYGQGDTGAGIRVAVFELERNFPADITAFESCYGISSAVSYHALTGADAPAAPSASNGDGVETEADVEQVIGLAPGAAVDVYQAANTDTGLYDAYNAIISTNSDQVISTSWGMCEPGSSASLLQAEATLFAEAATQGQSVLAAAGDNGASDCQNTTVANPSALAVDDPASQPDVTGVGGTTLTMPSTETVWNDGAGAGGGGISEVWTMPSYQRQAPKIDGVINADSSGTPCSAAAGTPCREVPDVSAQAGAQPGYALLWNGSWAGGYAGTSFAAPVWAAVTALSDGSSACAGTRLGLLNPRLYAAAGSALGSSLLRDVTSGNNITSSASGGFTAGPRYDMASGLGTPITAPLAAALCDRVTLSPPAPATGAVGSSSTVTLSASSSEATALTYAATGLPPGITVSGAKLIGTPTVAGTYGVTATATAAGGAAASQSFTWTIRGAGATSSSPTPAGGGSTSATGTTATATAGRPGGSALRPVLTLAPLAARRSLLGASVSLRLAADDSAGLAVGFRVSGLPAGLAIGPTGAITGRPSRAGVFAVTVLAADAAGGFAQASFRWSVYAPPRVAAVRLSTATGGRARLSFAITAAPGAPAVAAFILTAPAGIQFSAPAAGAATIRITEAGGRRLATRALVARGRLGILLAGGGASSLRVSIAAPAIRVSRDPLSRPARAGARAPGWMLSTIEGPELVAQLGLRVTARG